MEKSSFVKRVLLPVVVSLVCAGAVVAVFFARRAGRGAEREMLRVGDGVYIAPYEPQDALPFGYHLAGVLTGEEADGTGLAGCEYYINKFDKNGIYVYQKCRAAADAEKEKTGKSGWAYKRWVKVDEEKFGQQRLTLEDIVRLAEKGDALTEKDFDPYSYFETSREGMRVYEVDGNFSLWILGARGWRSEPGALHIYLRSRDAWGWEDLFEIRTGDVQEFIREHSGSASKKYAANAGTKVFPYPDGGIGNAACVGDYWYQGALVSLYDDGDACVYLSPFSSYMGISTYEVVGERVVIRTKDGWYTYFFDVDGDTLVFDGKTSIWSGAGPSKLVDGAVLE